MRKGMWVGFTLLAAVLTGCEYGPHVEGNGNLVHEERPVADFVELEVNDGIEVRVKVEPGAPTQVRLVGDENLVELIRTEHAGRDRLHVYFDDDDVGHWDSRNPLRAELTVSRLESVVRSGGSTMDVFGTLDARSFRVTASGGGHLRVSGLEAEDLDLQLSGGAEAILEGAATRVTSVTSGGSMVRARELSAREASLTSSGGGDVVMRVSGSLEVTASGGSDVHIIGQPAVRSRQLSGGSELTFE
jgi:hypothetical protein